MREKVLENKQVAAQRDQVAALESAKKQKEFSDKFTMNMLKSWRKKDYDENC